MATTPDLVGQMFMVDFTGLEPIPEVERLIVDDGVGGVILFDKNISAPRQVATLTNALQGAARASGRLPILLGVDQEGGPVARLRMGATHFPSAMAFGAARSEALAASAAGITARELRALGLHMNMAPDLDVNNNPANPVIGVRSYGEDPRLVARLGTASIRAMQASGVLATAKHFPGHGDTSQDSHVTLPLVPHTRARIEAVELVPFRAAIRVGVGAVMTAHVVFQALDPERPATLSPAVLGFLRSELGFPGLIVTDSMGMRAITDRISPGDAAVQAVIAGADLILALGPITAQREALAGVRRAVAAGQVPADRIAESAGRVVEAKRRLGLLERSLVSVDEVEARVGIPAHQAVADHVADAAATLVRDPGNVLPLRSARIAVVAWDADAKAAEGLARALCASGREAEVVPVASLDAVGAGVPLVVPVSPGSGPAAEAAGARMQDVVRAGLARGPVVAIATGTPYILARVPEKAACLAVYGTDPASLGAAARVLVGAVQPRGVLPVSLTSV
jgi:beta-N-acetylhexosaminidase